MVFGLKKKFFQIYSFKLVLSNTFFEMTIRIDDLTKEVALIVTDFFEGEDEEEELRLLWDNNIHKLKQAIGG